MKKPNNENSHWVTGVSAGLAVLGIVLVVFFLNRGYGKVGDHTYQITKSIYSICNLRDESRLELVEKLTLDGFKDKKISYREKVWILQIIQKAKRGNWKRAQQDCRRLMMAQVTY